MKKRIINLIRQRLVIAISCMRLQSSLLHNLQLALVEHLGQDSKHRIVVKIQLQRE